MNVPVTVMGSSYGDWLKTHCYCCGQSLANVPAKLNRPLAVGECELCGQPSDECGIDEATANELNEADGYNIH